MTTEQKENAKMSKSVHSKISMYEDPPTDTLNMDELVHLCMNRLMVLRKIEFLYDSNEQDG